MRSACVGRRGPAACALLPRGPLCLTHAHTKHSPTHTQDVVKCNIQTDPAKYKGIGTGFSVVLREQGVPGLFRGWLPTLLGYSAQGCFKFGLYEYFKK